jgi:hypothetical protein
LIRMFGPPCALLVSVPRRHVTKGAQLWQQDFGSG